MRLFAGQLQAFAWGMAAGWLVTYLSLTHERRTVKSVRKAVVELASYHDLTKAQSRMLDYEDWATDKEVWEVYRRVQRIQEGEPRPGWERRKIWRLARMWVVGVPLVEDPTCVAAEVVLCTKVLGLTEGHAWRTLSGSKTQGDIKQTLAAVTVEIAEERRRWEEKEAAEKA